MKKLVLAACLVCSPAIAQSVPELDDGVVVMCTTLSSLKIVGAMARAGSLDGVPKDCWKNLQGSEVVSTTDLGEFLQIGYRATQNGDWRKAWTYRAWFPKR